MTKSSTHRRWKGHCFLCAVWVRGDGKTRRMRIGDVRKLGLRSRSAARAAGGES